MCIKRKKIQKNSAIVFLSISFILILIMPIIKIIDAAYYDNTTVITGVNVTSIYPEVYVTAFYDNDSISGGDIILTPGTVDTLWCNGTINDENGWQDIFKVNATIYDKDNATSVDDNNVKYSNNSCIFSQLNTTAVRASCTFNVWFYANNDTWICNMTAMDKANLSGNGNANELVASLFALDLNQTFINYGEMAPGDVSLIDEAIDITNFGNMDINISLDGYGNTDGDGLAMDCDLGNISIHYERYAVQSGLAIASMYNLTDMPLPNGIPGFIIPQNQNDNGNSTNLTYWKIEIPTNVSVRGQCNGTVIFNAVG